MQNIQGVETNKDAVNMVDDILTEAIKEGASDIHFEPTKDGFIIRYRVNGVLRIIFEGNATIFGYALARIKSLAGLEVTGLPRPQEGDIVFEYEGQDVDLRISILPTSNGECAVVRVLANLELIKDFHDLGLTEDQVVVLERNIEKPHGLILITGPNGSGKSTTLFSILSNLNSPEKSLVTLEDPVERKMRRIRQTGVNPNAGLSFADGLRYLLRQDPDIIMVGEIRDKETARISVQAAITGHLVLATVHTNSAAGAIVRLIDMGVEPYMLSSAMRLVTAQRLVRLNCKKCEHEYDPPKGLLRAIGARDDTKFYHSIGCEECGNTGTSGRKGVHELLEINKEIQELILAKPNDEHIFTIAKKNGMIPLRERALELVYAGDISIEEALRLIG